jgi:hypothetical protein
MASLGDLVIKAGGVELKKNSAALVKNDYSSKQAGIDPKGDIQGFF